MRNAAPPPSAVHGRRRTDEGPWRRECHLVFGYATDLGSYDRGGRTRARARHAISGRTRSQRWSARWAGQRRQERRWGQWRRTVTRRLDGGHLRVAEGCAHGDEGVEPDAERDL